MPNQMLQPTKRTFKARATPSDLMRGVRTNRDAFARQFFALIVSLLLAVSQSSSQPAKSWQRWDECIRHAMLLHGQGLYAEAIASYQEALAIVQTERLTDAESIKTLEYLAAAYTDHGYWSQAEKEYQRALALIEKTSGRDSIEYAAIVGVLEVLSSNSIRPTNRSLIKLLRRALENDRAGSNPDYQNLAQSSLARLLIDDHHYREAESYLEAQYESVRSQPSPSMPALSLSAAELGTAESKLKKYHRAAALFQECLATREKMLGPDHPTSIWVLNNLAVTFTDMHQDEAAMGVFETIVKISKNHPASQTEGVYGFALENYAQLLKKLGRRTEAQRADTESREILNACRRRDGANATVPVSSLRKTFR